jgi:phenol 2-monooxygenase
MSVSLTKESEVDVLVIGAGPAGLMCANGLAKAGVKVRIIDKKYFFFE